MKLLREKCLKIFKKTKVRIRLALPETGHITSHLHLSAPGIKQNQEITVSNNSKKQINLSDIFRKHHSFIKDTLNDEVWCLPKISIFSYDM